jgi:hypothetical protein
MFQVASSNRGYVGTYGEKRFPLGNVLGLIRELQHSGSMGKNATARA